MSVTCGEFGCKETAIFTDGCGCFFCKKHGYKNHGGKKRFKDNVGATFFPAKSNDYLAGYKRGMCFGRKTERLRTKKEIDKLEKEVFDIAWKDDGWHSAFGVLKKRLGEKK